MVVARYRFDDCAYAALGQAGVAWQSVTDVLYAHPQLLQHVGEVLRIAAADRHGQWLAVVLIEEGDEEYLVVSARRLDTAEVRTITGMLEGGSA
jgi:hypothetical protein